MSTAATDLSIIIPSYNEEARLPETLERIGGVSFRVGSQCGSVGCRRRLERWHRRGGGIFRVKIPTLRVGFEWASTTVRATAFANGMQEARGRHRAFHGRRPFRADRRSRKTH